MGFKAYNTVNGMILGEHDGVTATDYQTDALGSVIGTYQANGTLQNTYRYAGYGQQVSKTGTAPDPKFLWVGGWGYRSAEVAYVRARHLDLYASAWTTVDPIWPHQQTYAYAYRRPATLVDPSGLQGNTIGQAIETLCGFKHCDRINGCQPKSDCFRSVVECMKHQGFSLPGDEERIRKALGYMKDACSGKRPVCTFISDGVNLFPPAPPGCENIGRFCEKGSDAGALPIGTPPAQTPPWLESLCKPVNDDCSQTLANSGCSCLLIICTRAGFDIDKLCNQALYHELVHCAGYSSPTHNNPNPSDFTYNLGCCMCKATSSPGTSEDACSGCKGRFSWIPWPSFFPA